MRLPWGDLSRPAIVGKGFLVVIVVIAAVIAGVYVGRTYLTSAATPSAGPRDAHSLPTSSAPFRTVYRSTSISGVTDGPDGLWVIDDVHDRLIHVDPSRGTSIGPPVAIPGRPTAVTDGDGHLWVASSVTDTVEGIDPRTSRIVSTTPVPAGPVSLSIGQGCLWVASVIAGSISCVDPDSGSVTATVALPDGAVRLVAGSRGVWVTGTTDTLSHVTPSATGSPPPPGSPPTFTIQTVRVGDGPIGVAIAGHSVWVADASAGMVTKVDRTTMQIVGTYRVGIDPVAVSDSLGGSRVWVADGNSRELFSIGAATGTPITKVGTLPGIPRQLLTRGGVVWVALGAPGSLVTVRRTLG